MTMGGTGDLLAGLLASLLPRSGSQIAAACMASFVNKKAADICYQEKSFWYDIHDMIRKIPEVFRYYHQY
jgi:NAD(P)H-hydrate epimerase